MRLEHKIYKLICLSGKPLDENDNVILVINNIPTTEKASSLFYKYNQDDDITGYSVLQHFPINEKFQFVFNPGSGKEEVTIHFKK